MSATVRREESRMVRVAAFQVSVDDREQPRDRIERVVQRVGELVGEADLIVLPELWTIGAFNTHLLMSGAEGLDGVFPRRMADLARATGAWLHAGSYPELHDRGVSNTSLLFDSGGTLRASYRKIHLFGFEEGEATSVVAGDRAVTADTPLGPTGLSTCYDLRFPELYRLHSATGAEALLVPSGWPVARVEHWRVLCRARAVENQAVLVGCNAVGTHAGVTMGGRSVIVDPQGEVLAEAGGEEETVLTAEVDPQTAAKWRADFPVLADRRLG
jgi:predicted amidohydrolase